MQAKKSNCLSIWPKNITSTRQCLALARRNQQLPLQRLHRLDHLQPWERGSVLDLVVVARLLADSLAPLVLPVDLRPRRKEEGLALWHPPRRRVVALEGLVVAVAAVAPPLLARSHLARQGGDSWYRRLCSIANQSLEGYRRYELKNILETIYSFSLYEDNT